MQFNPVPFFAIAALTLVIACTRSNGPAAMDAENLPEKLMERLINAADGEEILLPAGEFAFQRPLSLDGKANITIKGMGKGKTILSFKDQIEGAEGLIIKNIKGLHLIGFTVQDTKGDAIKVQACENVTMRGMETTWTDGPSPQNGGYGLYPVSCTNVLLENCEASYASDAGIYVGQSSNIVVRNNLVHHNVAGLEIENSRNGVVHNNVARENTGGILVFDMPDLPQANGYKIKVFENTIENNNHANFASPGTVVAILPPGSGVVLMAHKEIEVYNNVIKGHKTVGLSMLSWLFTERPFESKEYDPFCSSISIHDNRFEGNKGEMDITTDFGKLLTALTQGRTVDIAIDSIFNPASLGDNGLPTGDAAICLHNNGQVSFVNFNAGKGPTPAEMMQNKSTDSSGFDCTLNPVEVTGHDAWLNVQE